MWGSLDKIENYGCSSAGAHLEKKVSIVKVNRKSKDQMSVN